MLMSRLLVACCMAALSTSQLGATIVGQPTNVGRANAPANLPLPTASATTLVADPSIRFGRLSNGMRYALKRNTTPATGASLRLRIGAGAFNEDQDQLGLAHFIEHMVFNGSRNVPEGEFIYRLERIGLGFGSDTNAYTGLDETVYVLDLPQTKPEVVDTALFLLREVSGETSFDPAAIDRERGIVLSEERARESANLRTSIANSKFFFEGQLLGRTLPIGDVNILKTAGRDRFVRFYDRNYRPENSIFVAVGNFDVDDMERKIKARFGDWRGKGPAAAKVEFGRVAPRGPEAASYAEAGVPSSISIAWNREPDLSPDSFEKRRRNVVELLALSVLNRRFSRLARTPDAPFVVAGASYTAELFKSLGQTTLTGSFNEGAWRPALAAMEQEKRRIETYGVSQLELDFAIAQFRVPLERGVAGDATRQSSTIADQILSLMKIDTTITTAASGLARFDSYARDLRAKEVNDVLKTMFKGQGPLIFVTGPDPIPGGDAAVLAAYTDTAKLAVAKPVAATDKPWSYTNFGRPGVVAERRDIADLGVTFVRFANGVRLTVRPSRASRNEVQVSVRIANGLRDLSAGKASAAWVAREGLLEGGLGRLTSEEATVALVGKQYGVDFSIDEEAFKLGGSTQPRDLATQMQVLAAFVTDPGFRPDAVERTKSQVREAEKAVRTDPGRVLGRELPKLLHPGDKRFGEPSLDEKLATSMDDVRATLAPLKTGPIEVIMVGEVTVDEAIRRTAETFGALPPRAELAVSPANARTTLPTASAQPIRFTHDGRKDQGYAVVVWPTNDYFADYKDTVALNIMSEVLRLRLLDELREKEAVTYSPGVGGNSSKVFPGFGYVLALIEAPAAKHAAFFDQTSAIIRSLREKPPTQDEFDRAIRPPLGAIKRFVQTNGYWLNALANAQRDPRKLDVIRQELPALQKLVPADVQRVAKKYLRDEKALRMVAVPTGDKAAVR